MIKSFLARFKSTQTRRKASRFALLSAVLTTGLLSTNVNAKQSCTLSPSSYVPVVERGFFDDHGTKAPLAQLYGKTMRYPHGVFGKRFEFSELVSGNFTHRLAAPDVFEDRDVRAFDLNRNGKPDYLQVVANADDGARLMALELGAAGYSILAESEPIGIGNRWLNPVGVGDFNGDGQLQVASIRTPHIGGILELHSLNQGSLVKTHQMRGVSNHAFGDEEQRLSLVLPAAWVGGDRDVILAPTQSRRDLVLLGQDDHMIDVLQSFNLDRRISYLHRGEDSLHIESNGAWFQLPKACFQIGS